MCGNFSVLKEKRIQKKLLEQGLNIEVEVAQALDDLSTGTLFPSATGWVLTADRQLRTASWGLVPAWSKDGKIARHTFNARCETVREKPAFRDAFMHGRCLVPAQGWWEWDKARRKVFVRRRDEEQIWFAGLECGGTFTIVTKPAQTALEELHHRQPVLLDRSSACAWLGEVNPASEGALQIFRVEPDLPLGLFLEPENPRMQLRMEF